MNYVWIAIGGALGSMARFWIGYSVSQAARVDFPIGTLLINVLGSFIIGIASTWADTSIVRWLVMVGFCGGFTTFSSFSLEAMNLVREGQGLRALAYVLMSVGVCFGAVIAGHALSRR